MQHSVGFTVKNTLVAFIEPPSSGLERILAICLSTSSDPANIISVYAPTLCSNSEEKDQFYEALDETISRISSTEGLYLLGDINARVGADNESWPTCLGFHGRVKINENSQRLLEMCCLHGLCVTSTFFKSKEIHQVSWRHPRSHHWHQIRLRHHQACRTCQCPPHPQLPQCRLQHGPLPCAQRGASYSD